MSTTSFKIVQEQIYIYTYTEQDQANMAKY